MSERHDGWTVAALACLAFVAADLSHEVIGHGVTAYLCGARHLLLSSTYLSSEISNAWVQAGGTIVNLLEGVVAWLLLRRSTEGARWRYFLWLLMAFNLMNGTGYFLFSAVLNFGDWAEIVRGAAHAGVLRVVMGVAGAGAYVGSTYLCAMGLRPFAEKLEELTTLPYWTVLIVNCAAAALNPLGLKYVLISALPATAGANAGLWIIPSWTRRWRSGSDANFLVSRSLSVLTMGAVVVILFVVMIGRGIAWNR